jgi:hypothetical protein
MNNTISLLLVIIGFILFDRIVRHKPKGKPSLMERIVNREDNKIRFRN